MHLLEPSGVCHSAVPRPVCSNWTRGCAAKAFMSQSSSNERSRGSVRLLMTSELDRLSLALPNVAPGGMKLVSECKAAGPGLWPCPQAYKSLSQMHPSMSCPGH